MIRSILVSVLALLSTIAAAQAPPTFRVWEKITLENVRPSQMKDLLRQEPWWNTPDATTYRSKVTPEVEQIMAFDVDKSLLVRGTAEELAELKKRIAALDVVTLRVRFKTRIVPVLRAPAVLTPESAANFVRVTEKDVVAGNHLGEWLSAGPNAYNTLHLVNASSRPGRSPEFSDTAILAIPHVHENGSVSFLFELDYWASSKERKQAAKRVNRLWPGDAAQVAFPVEDPRHPVALYRLEITEVAVEDKQTSPPLLPAPPLAPVQS